MEVQYKQRRTKGSDKVLKQWHPLKTSTDLEKSKYLDFKTHRWLISYMLTTDREVDHLKTRIHQILSSNMHQLMFRMNLTFNAVLACS